ncbi:MAG: bifunctional pyr operon transcriptional regulator/uracil phosphoribosyltransferase PyrR [Bacilli bacterium]
MAKIVLDADGINRTLRRISHEIVENIHDLNEVVIVGIKSRGEFIAYRIAKNIENFEEVKISFSTLDITHFRDDFKDRNNIRVDMSGLDVEVDDKIVILVDDVLYTGRTIRAAMDAIILNGRPKMIKLVTLVDRGHRELPIRADFVGKNIPTSSTEKVNVLIDEVDKIEYIEIE